MAGKLAKSIKQTKPWKQLEEEAFLNVMRTADALGRREELLLNGHGLTSAQYNALRILRGAGDDGLPCGEIANRMIARDPDITRLVDRLEKRGLAMRSRDAADRRVVTIRISRAGLEVLASVDEPQARLHKELLGHLKQQELKQMIELLEKAREKAEPG